MSEPFKLTRIATLKTVAKTFKLCNSFFIHLLIIRNHILFALHKDNSFPHCTIKKYRIIVIA